MLEQFDRTILLMGEAAFKRLHSSHVIVVGCGAVGGFAIEALARTGIGHITLIDGDTVALSNINRQLCATHQTLHQPKVTVWRDRITAICPDTQITTHPVFWHANNTAVLTAEPVDFIIDAIDSLTDKVALIQAAQALNIPIIASMGAALKTDCTQVRVAPFSKTRVCPLAARMRRLLRASGTDLSFPCVFSTEPPAAAHQPGRRMGSLITLTGLFGLMLANEVIRRIAQHD